MKLIKMAMESDGRTVDSFLDDLNVSTGADDFYGFLNESGPDVMRVFPMSKGVTSNKGRTQAVRGWWWWS